LETIW